MAMTAAAQSDIEPLLRRARERFPEHAASARRLARHLYNQDALEELSQSFGPEHGSDPECLHYAGLAAKALGDHQRAEACFRLASLGGYQSSDGPRADALLSLVSGECGFDAAMAALENCPDDDPASRVAFEHLLARGRHAELWDLCERLRAAGGWTVRMVSAMALAARTPEQLSLVRRLIDYDAWLDHRPFEAFANRHDEFAELLCSMDWRPLPRSKATRGEGQRIENLQRAGDPLLRELFRQIEAAVAAYADCRASQLEAGHNDHPMIALRPTATKINSWAIRVTGNGHEDWHIHPDGWLSGVYYVDTPNPDEVPGDHGGDLEFGAYPLGPAATPTAWPLRRYSPKAGELALFPSYFGHRTWPTGCAKPRLCIAFDIMRRGIDGTHGVGEATSSQISIDANTPVRRQAQTVSLKRADNRLVAMNVERGQCLILDRTAEIVWRMLSRPRSAKELADMFAERFDAGSGTIAADLAKTLELFGAYKLVEEAL